MVDYQETTTKEIANIQETYERTKHESEKIKIEIHTLESQIEVLQKNLNTYDTSVKANKAHADLSKSNMENIQKEIDKLSHIPKRHIKSFLVAFLIWESVLLLVSVSIFIFGGVISFFISSFDNDSVLLDFFSLSSKILLVILICHLFSIFKDIYKICRLKKKKLLIDDNSGALNNSIAKYNDCKQQIEQIQKTIAQKSTELRNVDKQRSDIVGTLNRLKSKNENVQKFNSESSPITNMAIIDFIFCRKSPLSDLYKKLADYPYSSYSSSYSVGKLLTNQESVFFDKLNKIAKNRNWHIFTKVRLSDIITLGSFKNRDYSQHYKENFKTFYINFINQKHIDYVFTNADFLPLLCVELDDASHYDYENAYYSDKHIASHITKDIIFSYCRLPLLRIDSEGSSMSIEKIENIIDHTKRKKLVFYAYSNANEINFNTSLHKLLRKLEHIS